MNKVDMTGEIHNSNHCGKFKVIEYNGSKEVLVEFLNTGYKVSAQRSQILLGKVEDKFLPNTFGVGVVGYNKTKHLGKFTQHYQTWLGMLCRCYSEKEQLRNPTYIECTVSEHFQHLTNFKEWCNNQVGFGNKGWHLDKDILHKGNKVYSEDTCCFVPYEINVLFTKRSKMRGSCPIGVSKRGKKFQASISINGKQKCLGSYNHLEEAFEAYKQAKENHIKLVANKWKDAIDPRVYEALTNYKVEITD